MYLVQIMECISLELELGMRDGGNGRWGVDVEKIQVAVF